mgnify:CR=1 FL=1
MSRLSAELDRLYRVTSAPGGEETLQPAALVDAQGRVVDKIVGAREWDSPESLKLIGKAFRIRL